MRFRRVSAWMFGVMAAGGAWAATVTAVPPLPEAATSFGAAVLNGSLYLYGGHTGERHTYSADKVTGAFYRVDLRTPSADWEALPRSLAAQGTALVEWKGRLYRVGGMAARNLPGERLNLQSLDTVGMYDPSTLDWSELPALPEPRSSHDAAIIGSRLYVAGGWRLNGGMGNGTFHTNVLFLDLAEPKAWEAIPQPFRRRGHAVAALGERLYFIGGMNADNSTTLEVDILDTRTGTWTSGPALPPGKLKGFGNSAVTAGDRIYVSGLSGEVHALGANSTEWEDVGKLKQRRFFHRLVAVDAHTLLALGGEDEEGKIRDVEVIRVTAPSASAATSSEAWPQWRGPARDGVAADSNWSADWPEEGPPRLWQAKVGVGVSSPVVAGGLVFLAGNDGKDFDEVVAVDLVTGVERWRHRYASVTRIHEMPIVPNGPGATPTVVGNRVYTLSRDGQFQVLDQHSGAVVWSRHLVNDLGGKRPVYGYTQSPLVEDGRVIVEVGAASGVKGSIVALDAATGTEIWRGGEGEAGYSSARAFKVGDERLLAVFQGEAIRVMAAADGSSRWSYALTTRDYANALTPVLVGQPPRLLVSHTGGQPAALFDWQTGATSPVWKHDAFAQLFNNAVVHEGCLFAFNEQRRGASEFTCVDAATGETRWVSDAVPLGVFVLSQGQWVFFTRQGEVVVTPASVTGLTPGRKFQALGGRSYATPALAGGILVARNNDGDVAAYDLRSGAR